MGGRISLITAGAHPDKVAAASFHGGMIAMPEDPDSPHLNAPRITATVYVAGAEARRWKALEALFGDALPR